jgi:hypothetical protein
MLDLCLASIARMLIRLAVVLPNALDKRQIGKDLRKLAEILGRGT